MAAWDNDPVEGVVEEGSFGPSSEGLAASGKSDPRLAGTLADIEAGKAPAWKLNWKGEEAQGGKAPEAKPVWADDPVEEAPASSKTPASLPGDWETAKASVAGMNRQEFLEANPLVNLGAWAIKQVTGQKVKGTLELGPELKEPEPTVGESLKAAGKFIAERPLTAMAELAKGLFYSPELAFLSLAKGPQFAARMAELAEVGRVGRAAAMTGASALEGAAVMGGLSALQQSAQTDEVKGAEVGAQAAMGAIAVPVLQGAARLLTARPKIYLKDPAAQAKSDTPTLDRFTESVREGGEYAGEPRAAAKTDAQMNAERVANDLMQRGASIKEVERSIKNNPLVGKEMEAIRGRRAEATGAMKDVVQGEVLPPEVLPPEGQKLLPDAVAREAQGTPSPVTEMAPRPDWNQRGEADPKLLAAIGLTAVGAAGGAYLAGDDKVAGAVLGGIAGAGMLRLPSTLSALGKTLSYKGAMANALRMGAVVGAGTYIGDKSGNPVEGAAIAGAILLGRVALRPSVKLSTDDMIRVRNGSIAAQERITHNLKRDINTAVPEVERRVAISEALDQGNPAGLSEAERGVYSAVRGFNEQLGREAVDAGVIKGMRSNYISYIVERDPAMTPEQQSGIIRSMFETGAFSENASPSTKFGKRGKYETFTELNNALKGSGLKLKTQDVGEIAAIYGKAMRTAIENRLLIDNLRGAKTGEGANFLQARDKNGNLPQGYRTLEHPQLQGYGIHPDLFDSAKVVFSNSDPNVITRGLLGLSMATKRVQVFGSLFHAKSLAEVYINGMGKDVYTKGAAPINEALRQFREGGLGDTLDLGLRNGLNMSVPEDVSLTIIGNIGKKLDQFVPLKAGTAVTDKIDFVNGKLDKITWDYMHAGIKGALFTKEFENLMLRNAELHAKDPGKFPLKPREQIAREVAKYTNDLAGGLDWFGIAADTKTQFGRNLGMFFASPEGRRFAQIVAFAPDWATSTLRAGFNAFGHSDRNFAGLWKPENAVDLYRRYALRSTLYWMTLLNGINIATSGHSVWGNKDPTRIEFEDGTSMQAGKHTFESVHAVGDPVKFAYNKLGFTPKMVINFFSGKEGYGPTAPVYESFPRHAAQTALPFTVSATTAQGLTPGEKAKRAVLSGIGLPVYGTTAAQKATGKAERREKKLLKKRREMGLEG
jgi:hypothetical protein